MNVSYKKFKKFNTTCGETLDNCLYAFYFSSSFEEAVANALTMGGDTDTNCTIVGSMAEALYGVDDNIKKKIDCKIPKEFVKILSRAHYNRWYN